MYIIVTDCGKPTSPANGTITLEMSNVTTYGVSANQSCDVGYELNGTTTITCTENGTWSASPVICTMKGTGLGFGYLIAVNIVIS